MNRVMNRTKTSWLEKRKEEKKKVREMLEQGSPGHVQEITVPYLHNLG